MAEEKQPDLSLASLGMTPSELGKAMIQESNNQQQKQRLKANLERVRGIQQELAECESKLEAYAAWKQIAEAKLAAIESGDFKFNKWGEMVFNDEKLQASETTTFDPQFVTPRNR